MAVNKTNKGNRYELEARKALIADGFLVEKKNNSRWESNDFWGMFDIIAIHPQHGLVRLIQIKTNATHFYKARIEIKKWAFENKVFALNVDCEVWLREPRKPWRRDLLALQQQNPTLQNPS